MAAALPAGKPDKEDETKSGCVENKDDDVEEFGIDKKDSAEVDRLVADIFALAPTAAVSFCSLSSKRASLASNSFTRCCSC